MTADVVKALALPERLQQLMRAPLWVWCLIALAAYLGIEVAANPPPLTQSLGDTDDATRLVQVRELMAGASWYDTTLARFGTPSAPLVSHWSRLVDVPLAMLMGLFGLFVPQAEAELAPRAVWPMLLLVPMLYVIARIADERGGRGAALLALALTVLSFAAIVQFQPGRIDHHNLMNLAAVAGLALLAHSLAEPRSGWLAGAALGLGLSIGYESLLVTAGGLAVATVYAVAMQRGLPGVMRAAKAFALTLAVTLVITTAPSAWGHVRCDALSLNMVLLAAVCAAGLGLVAHRAMHLTPLMRLAALGGVGALGALVFGWSEPACLAGPFGQVDARVYPAWLSHVSETKSWLWLMENAPATAIAFAAHVLAGVLAAGCIARSDRDDPAICFALLLALTAVLSMLQVKLMPYAALLALPPIAVLISRLPGSEEVSRPTMQVAAAALLNQKTLLLIGALIVGFSHEATEALKQRTEAKKACLATPSFAPLVGLSPGLAVAEVDMGPYLVALTPLSAFSAPYHRLDTSIIETHAILRADAAVAEQKLRAQGAEYVVMCERLTKPRPGETALPAEALKSRLLAGDTPAFLQQVPLSAETPLKVWRLKP